MKRLLNLPTLRLDPAEKRRLHYRGQTLAGLAGDSVATALFANGVRIFGRSLKYHRPRGLYSLDGEGGNTLMEVDGLPNVSAETTLLRDGMRVAEQNVVGSAERDLLGFLDKLSLAMPAGFYYQTLHKPAFIWPLAMKLVRKMAGWGKIAPDFERQGTFDQIYPTAEVCVIGGGPAGMSAALAAAENGLRVILLERRPWLGGSFDHRAASYDGDIPLYQHARRLADRVESTPGLRVFKQAAVVGVYANNLITAVQTGGQKDTFDERYLEIRAQALVVAAGCIERPLLFEHNERPGVMQVGCAHRLARTYGLLPGREAVFSIGHDQGLEAALDLHDLGLKIACVADMRAGGQASSLLDGLAERKIRFRPGWTAVRALGAGRVRDVVLASLDGASKSQYPCDLLVASAGLTPVVGPLSLAGADLEYDPHTGYFLPVRLPAKVQAAGRLLGLEDPRASEASGRLAGLNAAADCGREVAGEIEAARTALKQRPGPAAGNKLVSGPITGAKSFVCFDEDVTVKHIKQALAKGFDVPELIKRFTSAGTGPGQGGVPGHNLPLLAAQLKNEPLPYPPTTIRAPLVPAYISTYAGARHDMHKRTPVHDLQTRDGGIFRRIGVWRRARYFSDDFSCRQEIENVRNNVGMLDASTLGKFRIHGPDALKALQRVYVSDLSRIKPGRIKYSAMCNDDGCVVDDGVVVKLADNDYYFTTSTARAGVTGEWFRYHTRFDGWDYHIVNLTDARGVINLSGPNARRVLEKITDADVSNESFPFGGFCELAVAGVPVRAMRLGFVGELSYELHVPSSYMPALWDLVVEAGREFGIQNFGLEAQNVLRLEKGHIILGQESEQRTNLLDLGLGFLWDRSKSGAKTVGAVALRQAENDPGRLTLVGFKMEDPARAPREGSVIVDDRIRGYVCTACRSLALKEAVGMALVESPLARTGTRLGIYEDESRGAQIYAKVAPMPFYDPEGRRMRM
ncbi:MAG: FAD-dependent oxidoreductase [Thermodesulfobacteriota bacterium]